MKPGFEPAKRHSMVRMNAAALSTTGIRAEKRMLYIGVAIPQRSNAMSCKKSKN